METSFTSENSSRSSLRNSVVSSEPDVAFRFYTRKKGLTVWGATLAFISTIIGGGIVGLPFSFYQAGIPLGIVLNIVIMLLTIYACRLLLLTKDLTGGLETFSEFGFVLYGSKAITIVNLVVFLQSFGLIMIYFSKFAFIELLSCLWEHICFFY